MYKNSHPELKVILPDGVNIETDDGDVRSVADLPEDPKSDDCQTPSDRVDLWCELIDNARTNGNFKPRNKLLLGVAGYIGIENRHRGAASMLDSGNHIPGYGGKSEVADEAAKRAGRNASNLARIACAECPLSDFCPLTPDKLTVMLTDPKKRRRFKVRVSKENNHFCIDNLSDGKMESLENNV